MNPTLVQFLPGQDLKAHLHNIMEENSYIAEGEIDVMVGGVVHHLTPGQFVHIESHGTHCCINHYDKPAKVVSILAPYQEVDRAEIENYTYGGR